MIISIVLRVVIPQHYQNICSLCFYFFLFKKYNTSCFRGSFTFGAGNLTLPNHHLNTTKYNPIESMAPQIKSMTECCFRKTVERQMRTVRTHETFLMRFLELSFCICLLLTKQRWAEIVAKTWMLGQTLVGVSLA